MAHGYLREYDERWDRSDDRDRGDRNWREASERNRSFMFGDLDRSPERRPTDFRGGADWERSPRNFSNRQDDHYLSWRDKQIETLDRDYADYCREREQEFHRDFDSWRSQRRGNNPGPLRTGMTQTGQSHDPTGTLELTNEATDNTEPEADPMSAATLGTNSRGSRQR